LFINNINYYKLIIENHRWHLLGALTGALIVNVILNYLFIPKGGYIAASYITVITELLLFVYYMIILLRSKMPNKHEQYI
jgi:O-antigen/teichoic acid export membrane protein